MFRSSFPILYVDDVSRAVRFYRDLLGFEELYRFPPEADEAFVSLALGGDKVALSPASFPGIHGKPQRPVTGRPFELCLETADVDGAIARLRDGGATILAEPADQPWGERVAYVEDPDGNPVHVRGPVDGGA